MILTDIFSRPKKITVVGCPIQVPVFTIGDLVNIQTWVNENSWSPWDVPYRDDPAEYWSLKLAKSEHWPPLAWSLLARQATDHVQFTTYFLYRAVGRHNGLNEELCMTLNLKLTSDEFDMIYACAYDIHPRTIAGRQLNLVEGCEPPEMVAINWNEDLYNLLKEYPGLDPMKLEDMSLSLYRFLSLKGNDLSAEKLYPIPGKTFREASIERLNRMKWARQYAADYYSANGESGHG